MRTIIIKLFKKLLRRNRAKPTTISKDFVIPRAEHNLSKTEINPNALKVLNRLNSAGYQAYLVGGSVRDILLNKVPKDFDVATNATPTQIRGLFRNGRIIGRRFKLVHVIFYRDIIEVATFRGSDTEESEVNQQTNDKGMLIRDNVYGSLDEDAWRRDFTVNSLYYNIEDASLVDFTGGFQDIHNGIIRIIGNADTRYQEDPVRMLRAVRFCAKLNFDLAEETAEPLSRLSHLITHVSSARLFDEIAKLYQCGEAKAVQFLLVQYNLFQHLFPQTHALADTNYPVFNLLDFALESTDARIEEGKPINPAFILAVILWFPLLATTDEIQASENASPLVALEKAMNKVLQNQNAVIFIPKRFTQVIREIWLLQFRFSKRHGERAFNTLNHPRFRAAYDFMAIRALAGDEDMVLADWWTHFQEANSDNQLAMISSLTEPPLRKRRKRKKPNKPSVSDS